MNSGVYRIRNRQTGECYVGSAAKLNVRESGHWSMLRLGTHKNAKLTAAHAAGQGLAFEVLERCPVAELLERENHWIKELKPAYNSSNRNARKTKGCAEASISFTCSPEMVAAVDAFAARHGMASRGHAMRRIVQSVIDTPQTRGFE